MITDKALEAIGGAVDVCLDEGMTYREANKAFLREWLQQSLSRSGNNSERLRSQNGIHRNTLNRLAQRVGISIKRTWTKNVGA